MVRRMFFAVLLVIVILSLAGVGAGIAQEAPVSTPEVTAGELQDLHFFLSFIPNVQFSPIYTAITKGYFAEAGYNLVIEQGDENVGVEQIAVGDIPFGMISGEQVILARSNARPVVYVYEWFQKYPIAIVIPDTTPASTITDLKGRKVGLPGRFGANYSGLTALLAVNGMTETDIQVEVIGFNAPDVICVGAIDAAAVYINNEPLQIQQRADAGNCGSITRVSVIPVADSANLVSNGIVTNETMIAENRETVQAVVSAFERGLRDAINNPAEAYLISLGYVENLPLSPALRTALEAEAAAQAEFLATDPKPDREAIAQSRADLLTRLQAKFAPAELIQFQVLMATIALWDADVLGETDAATWELTQQVLTQMGAVSGEIDLASAYTNDFLPTSNTGSE